MSRRSPFLLAIPLAACAAVAPVRIEDSPFDAQLVTPLLQPSGLRVYLNTDQREPIVNVTMVVGAGFAQDPPGKAGLAHLVEHLAFLSTDDARTTARACLQRLGVVHNAVTSLDHTIFTAFAPRPSWGNVLALETRFLVDPLAGIDEPTFRRELDVVRNEMWQDSETHGWGRGLARLQAEIYEAGEPYGRAGGGAPDTLVNLTLDDARAFAARHYRPDNATLLLDGDLPTNAPAAVTAALPDTVTARRAPRTPPGPETAAAEVQPARLQIVRATSRVTAPELWIGWALPPVFAGPNSALVALLGSLAQSELNSDSFRADAPDVARVSVHPLRGRRGTLLTCRAVLTPKGDPVRAARAITDHLSTLGTQRVRSLAGINNRRHSIHNLTLFGDDDLAQRGNDWALYAHVTGDPRGFQRNLSHLLVDLDPLAADDFIRDRLSVQRARAVFLTPGQQAQALAPTIAADDVPAIAPSAGARPFPDTPAALAAALGDASPRISVRTLPNGLNAIAAVHGGFRGASAVLGFHGGAATETPAGVVEITDVAGVFSVSDLVCGSLTQCGVVVWPSAVSAEHTRRSFSADRALIPHLLHFLAQQQDVDWVRWPDDLPARQYRAFRHVTDGNPERANQRALDAALFANHRFGHHPQIEELERIDSDTALTWSRRHQTASNTAVVVVGNVDGNATLDQIADAFGGWSNSKDGAPTDPPPPVLQTHATPPVSVVAWPGSPQTDVQVACRLPAVTIDNVAWHDVFGQWIGDHLHRTLRERLAATYGFATSHHEFRGGISVMRTGGLVANASLRPVLDELKSLLATLGEGKWPTPTGGAAGDKEDAFSAGLYEQRWTYLTRRSLSKNSSKGLANELLHEWNLGWPIDGGARTLAGLTRVDRDGLAALARTCHDTAVFSLAGEPAVTAAALAGTLR